ncbi:MAG: hypothetical protein JNM68_08625, partial [Dinghuibacter sp.]|nr:hypothetical protein [Dinghuibacter sp.]
MRFLVYIIIFFVPGFSHAQYEHMLHKTFAEKIPLLVNFYANILKIHDPEFQGKAAIIDELQAFGEKHNDQSLVTEAALAKAWDQSLRSPDGKLETQAMREFIDKQKKAKDYVSVARAWRMLGDMYWQKNKDCEM